MNKKHKCVFGFDEKCINRKGIYEPKEGERGFSIKRDDWVCRCGKTRRNTIRRIDNITKPNKEKCECGHFNLNHTSEDGCLGCPCKKGFIKTKIKKGYVAMNEGEFDDLQNMTFLNNLQEAKKWKGQKIIPVEIKFILGVEK